MTEDVNVHTQDSILKEVVPAEKNLGWTPHEVHPKAYKRCMFDTSYLSMAALRGIEQDEGFLTPTVPF